MQRARDAAGWSGDHDRGWLVCVADAQRPTDTITVSGVSHQVFSDHRMPPPNRINCMFAASAHTNIKFLST